PRPQGPGPGPPGGRPDAGACGVALPRRVRRPPARRVARLGGAARGWRSDEVPARVPPPLRGRGRARADALELLGPDAVPAELRPPHRVRAPRRRPPPPPQ